MATFSAALANVKTQIEKLVPDSMILDACVESRHRWRKRKLDPVMTVHLLLLQLLSGVALIRLDRVAQLGVSAVAVCRARARLPLAIWMKLAQWTGRSCRECGKIVKYLGHRVVIGDGTSFTTPDTPELAGKYGLMVVHARGKGLRKRMRQLGRQDMLVSWHKPKQHKLKWLSKQRWNKLPPCLTLRQISFRLYRKGFGAHWVWVITTLIDSKKYTAQSLAELYGKRWKIELSFRDLKSSMKMNHLTAKSVDGVKKQILAFVILYNLVRRLMQSAAEKQKVPPDRISFIDTLTALL